MTRFIEAVYENGVQRPLSPVELEEHQRVLVTISPAAEAEEGWLDVEFIREARQQGDDNIRLEDVRQALAGIAGSLAEDVRKGREDRC